MGSVGSQHAYFWCMFNARFAFCTYFYPNPFLKLTLKTTEVDWERSATTLAEPSPFFLIFLCLACLAAAGENHRELFRFCPVWQYFMKLCAARFDLHFPSSLWQVCCAFLLQPSRTDYLSCRRSLGINLSGFPRQSRPGEWSVICLAKS